MPPSQPSPYRQLGSGGQQPVRIQLIMGLVVALVLVAVPLYLWRRPQPGNEVAVSEDADAGTIDAEPYVPLVDAAALTPKVKLSPFRTLNCKDPGPGKTPPERCDHITFFEDALARAIQENVHCAPQTQTGATISIVMNLHFRREKVKIYHGVSSTIPASRTKEFFECITKAMPTPDWGSLPHQHTAYAVNVKATFPPSDTF